jgi:ABC-2 type transport system permease protein
MRILDIAVKDLVQLVRDRKTFVFLLLMPLVFTLLFGFAFGGFSRNDSDPRLPVGFLDLDKSRLSQQFHDLLNESQVIRLEESVLFNPQDMEALVADEKLAAAVIIPSGYEREVLYEKPVKVTLIADTGSTVGMSIESEVLTSLFRLESAVRTGVIMEDVTEGQTPFDYTINEALSGWQSPPISVTETTISAIKEQDNGSVSLAHTSPGMMLQFSIASLLTSAQILVFERKSRSLQRMLTTATRRIHILFGHYLAILVMIICQFLLLILFGQLVLGLNYLRSPDGTLLIAFSAAVAIAALGLLIGVVAKTEEQAVVIALILMFVLSGLGGAWVPLEFTGPAFQTAGHISPIAWALDGFKDILIRGEGLEAAIRPATALFIYAVVFFALAVWRFQVSQEK